MRRLGVYFGDFGENPDEVYVPVARARSVPAAMRIALKEHREQCFICTADAAAYEGIVTSTMHDHAPDENCPGCKPRRCYHFAVSA